MSRVLRRLVRVEEGIAIVPGVSPDWAWEILFSAYRTLNSASVNDRVNTASVVGVLFTTVDDLEEAEETMVSSWVSRSSSGILNFCKVEVTAKVGCIVAWSGSLAAPDLAGAGVL